MKWLMLQPITIDNADYIASALQNNFVQPIGFPVADGYKDPSTGLQWLDMSILGTTIDVNVVFGDAKDEDAIYYLYTYVYSPKARGVVLRFSAGPIDTSPDISYADVYSNGSLVWSDYIMSPSNGTTNIPFNLGKGWNTIMVKAVVYDATSSNTVLYGDIVTANGLTISELVYTVDPDDTVHIPASIASSSTPTYPEDPVDDFITTLNSDPELLSLSEDINTKLGTNIITPVSMLVGAGIALIIVIILVG